MVRLNLTPEIEKLIQERMRRGQYASPEEVVTAALHSLEDEERAGDFSTDELDELLTAGEQSGQALDGESVLRELRDLRSGRKRDSQ